MNWAKACLPVLLAVTARAQRPDVRQSRDISARWVEYYAAAYGVPVDLVEAIIDEESGWNPYAVSSKGAVGLMQLMPGTALRFGVHDRFRIDENIHGGVAYLAWLKQRFNGDLRLMTAAYYVGRIPDFAARPRLFLARRRGIRSTRFAALSGKTNGERKWGKTIAKGEVTE